MGYARQCEKIAAADRLDVILEPLAVEALLHGEEAGAQVRLVFDTNKYANNPKTDFLNWPAINAGTFDYAGDAWGYTYGAAAEGIRDPGQPVSYIVIAS